MLGEALDTRTPLLERVRFLSIRILPHADLKKKQRRLLRRHFEQMIFAVLTPLAFDPRVRSERAAGGARRLFDRSCGRVGGA